MNNIIAITKRELRGYFDSPVAYIVVVVFLLVSGWMLFSSLFIMGRADLRPFFSPSPFSPSMLLVILSAAITMRLVAEERKSGTLEMLTTMPIKDSEVVLGKFLAGLGLLASALLFTAAYVLTVAALGDLDWGPVISGYLGLLLFSGALVAMGIMCSTWTSNQIVAFIVSFILGAGLYYIYWLQFFLPEFIAPIAEYISVSFHLDNMARGVIDSRDVLYYLTITGGSLFLAVRSLEQQHA
ncbi:MAG: ABC transporter permease [Myxococcota bacterium]|jgi:ABC-2 type transport system permease protein|nr:ABC transporter permease [Myxococcota bacterium]